MLDAQRQSNTAAQVCPLSDDRSNSAGRHYCILFVHKLLEKSATGQMIWSEIALGATEVVRKVPRVPLQLR